MFHYHLDVRTILRRYQCSLNYHILQVCKPTSGVVMSPPSSPSFRIILLFSSLKKYKKKRERKNRKEKAQKRGKKEKRKGKQFLKNNHTEKPSFPIPSISGNSNVGCTSSIAMISIVFYPLGPTLHPAFLPATNPSNSRSNRTRSLQGGAHPQEYATRRLPPRARLQTLGYRLI